MLFFWESDPVFKINRLNVVKLVAKNRLPATYPEGRWVEDGGMMAYGTDLIEVARRAAIFVDKILKGTKPAELPVEQPTKFELAINLKTAKQTGVTIPQSVLSYRQGGQVRKHNGRTRQNTRHVGGTSRL